MSGSPSDACDLTLDPNTAHRYLSLSEDNRKVTLVGEDQSYPDHPERFNSQPHVLGREALTGRCYWEVEWKGVVEIGVTYRGITRRGWGGDSSLGLNNKSWVLYCEDGGYSARYNGTETAIPLRPAGSTRVGVYLDRPAGSLSFYRVSPEFVGVGMVDEVQFVHYDSVSKRLVPKQAWMDQVTRDRPDYWEWETGRYKGHQQVAKVNVEIVKKRFNQTGGAHIVQVMSGCEWDDEDDTTDGYHQLAYDGEDFLAWDLKTLTWVAPVRQAVPSKLRWDQNRALNQYYKHYYTKECVDWLNKYLAYGKSTLQRTGFFPDRVVVFWRRDGQELHEQVDPGEVLPNHDGTFQVSVDLDLTAVPQEDWGRYECVVQLKGIEDIPTPLDPALIRTNGGKSHLLVFILVGVAVAAVVVAAAVVGVFVYQKRNDSDKRLKPVGE
ncbi:unnamed protein product [Arctogadus glacialis]